MNAQGELLVEDVCLPGIAPTPPLSVTVPATPYVLLVSGLDIGSTADLMPLQLMQEYVSGLLGAPQEQQAVSGICRVIICGNTVKQSEELLGDKVGVRWVSCRACRKLIVASPRFFVVCCADVVQEGVGCRCRAHEDC